jgi:hypothetical protein
MPDGTTTTAPTTMLHRLLCGLLAVAPVVAQAPYAVGARDVAWANTTGAGAGSLTARVLYPATSAGTNTPLLPQAGGWPVAVFLHGFAITGTSYVPLGTQWAQQGFVVVLSNTSQFDNVGQENDGRALFPAVVAANAAGGPFQNGLDTTRVVLAGNRIVLIGPRTSAVELKIESGFGLAAALGGGRLAIGDPSHVPAGRYARDALKRRPSLMVASNAAKPSWRKPLTSSVSGVTTNARSE